MNGEKIRLLKQAVRFVADNLSPTDRLSVIPFANAAWRLTPLRSMTSAGKSDTFRAINSLRANGGTNIISGLKLAVQVLEQRREKNPVSSIILLSDGHDNQNGNGSNFVDSLCDLPPCLRANDSQTDTVPVYTFGFGIDHDAAALHAVADGSGGTFSYIESIEVIQDAFARCIGGLLSVVSQEVEIDLKTVSDGVQIQSISSGRYRNKIDSDKLHGMIYVGEVYAEEEKKFLAYLSVTPVYMQTKTTQLLKVKCRYKDPLSNHNQYIMSDIVSLQIRRPLHEDLTEEEKKVNLEVDRERNRVSITEGITEAQAMAERGDLWMARAMLQQRRKTLMQSASALAGDEFCQRLESEVNEIHERMSSMPEYEAGGRAYTFSRQSSHTTQRASTQAITPQMMPQVRPHTAPVGAMEFQTSNMTMLVFKSQEMLNIGNRDDKAGASSSKSTKR
ncbi:E3 ubiquitin-protein ligase WAV3 [Bienertia sinuspersici]